MSRPRIIYAILTFVTYAAIHSVRTALSYMKVSLQQQPLNFNTQFLGELDMTILISLAISLKTLGWIGQRIGHKLFLHIGMIYLAIVIFIIAILQLKQYTQQWIYLLLYSLAGIASCTGWPSCLAIISMYYPPNKNGFKLCIWNGCSQFGDFLALGIGFIFIDVRNLIPQSILIGISVILIVIIIANICFLDIPDKQYNSTIQIQQKKQSKSEQVLEIQSKKQQQNKKNIEQNKQPSKSIQKQIQLKSQQNNESTIKKKKFMRIKISGHRQINQVNFLNVWLLPSVASYVLCYGCLKSVNAIIMYWLYFYLNSIGINQYPKTITLSWSLSIFIGSIFMGYYNNRSINKIALIIPLGFTSLIFMYLGKQYSRQSNFHYLVLMILSGLFFGGPYGLIGSTITLLLGKNPQIKDRKGALGAIIALMEGFGQFSGAFFVLVVPLVGLSRLYYLPSILCLISGGILFMQHRKQINSDRRQLIRIRQQQLQNQRNLVQSV